MSYKRQQTAFNLSRAALKRRVCFDVQIWRISEAPLEYCYLHHLVKAMVFPVVVFRCESWTIKKAEC